MRPTGSTFYYFFFLLLLFGSTYAQVFPVQGSLQMLPPFSPYLTDYTTPGSQKLTLQLLPNDITLGDHPVRLRLSIEGVGITIGTKPNYIPPVPHTLMGGGTPTILYGEDLSDYFNPDNLDFAGFSRSDFQKSGKLPEGVFRFSFEVFDYYRRVPLSNKIMAVSWVVLNDPPLLNLPLSNTKITLIDPVNIAFTWTPRHTASPNAAFSTEYVFKLVEIWPANRNPYDAFLSQPPLHEATINESQLIYGPAEPALITGRKYAWQVQAKDVDGKDIFKNQGKSEVFVFQFGNWLGTPENLRKEWGNDRTLTLRWDPSMTGETPDHYNIRYKALAAEVWYEALRDQQWVTLENLQPNTDYDVQVRSKKDNTYSDYTAALRLKTAESSAGNFVCGQPPATVNTDKTSRLLQLIPGDVLTCNDWRIVVREASRATNGEFAGKGLMAVKMFGGASIEVIFHGHINAGYQLITGGVESLYNRGSEMGSVVEEMKKIGEKKTPTPKTPTDTTGIDQVVFPGIIDSVYFDKEKKEVVVVDKEGKKTTYPQKTDPKTKEAKPMQITDSAGNTVTVGKDGTVTKGSGGSSGSSEGKTLVNKKLGRMVLVSLNKFKKEIEDYQEAQKQVPPKRKGGGPNWSEWETEMLMADLPKCLKKHKAKLNEIKNNIISLLDSTSTAFTNFAVKVEKKMGGGDKTTQGKVDEIVCETLVEGNSESTSAGQLMVRLQQIFNDNNRIIISNQAALICPDLSANLKPEQDKITTIPATLDTRIYITENSEFDIASIQSQLSTLPENKNIRVFIVIISDDKITGLLNRRLADQSLSNLDKYYSVQRTVSGANKCAVAEQLVKDFLKDYKAALTTYYSNLNKQFPNKICGNINLTLSSGTPAGGVNKEGGLEDYAGLPSEVGTEIKTYLSEFSQAYGHSIKAYFTSHTGAAPATPEATTVFENIKGKFDKGEFDNASYGIWLHYDNNTGCIYIRHGLNENKVFQDGQKSKITKTSDKQSIIAEAKKTIDNVIVELDSKGAQSWSPLASGFKSIWKATVSGIATIYDMGRETYETGQTPVRLWDDTKTDQYGASPFHDPTNGIGAGGGDAIVAKVMEIPQLVSFGYDIATKEQVRTQLVNTVQKVSWPKIQNAASDYFNNKKDKYTGGGNVAMHEASLDASSILLELLGGAKILEMLEDLLKKLGKEAREAVVQAVKEKLTDSNQITRFIKDIDGSDELLNAVAKKTDLIDSWKKLDQLGNDISERLRRSSDFIKSFDEVLNNINLNKHTFKGDVEIIGTNNAGKPIYKISGVHSNKAFTDGTVRIKPDTAIEDLGDGFYRAKVEKKIDGFANAEGSPWKVKTDKSTFFPNSWSIEKIQAEIAHAFHRKSLISGNKYQGLTTGGKKITLFIDETGNIKTAFPDL